LAASRSYGDVCAVARALDAVGERWALLIVRELLFGAQRFSDLSRALPGASSNMLTDRLRELEARGVVCRQTLPPPAGSRVYELTTRGRDLEPVLEALGVWGRAEPPAAQGSLSATSVLFLLRHSARAHPDPPTQTFRLRLDDRAWTISGSDGQIDILPDRAQPPDATLDTDPATLLTLLLNPASLKDALASGSARVEGNLSAVRRLLRTAAAPAQS
jgi:DNA-binding HxlR family transcriptional regulator